MGTTNKSIEEVAAFAYGLQKKEFKTYHFLLRNCNHFSNDLCLYLTGKEIPSHLLNQAWKVAEKFKLFAQMKITGCSRNVKNHIRGSSGKDSCLARSGRTCLNKKKSC